MLVLQIEALECTQMRGERRFFKIFWGRTPRPRQGSRLQSFAVAGCAVHNLSPYEKFHSPLKILDHVSEFRRLRVATILNGRTAFEMEPGCGRKGENLPRERASRYRLDGRAEIWYD